ncbi:MAG: hypothetical protein J1F10_00195 [Muribaculaceae bacterium]|nr:hypothetical protein [Muribaculaceae bacterium]
MKIKKLLLVAISFATTPIYADMPESFQNFRQGILEDFQDFRSTILDHYADFLNGTWHEYETLAPKEKPKIIKPIDIPNITLTKPSDKPIELPTPTLADIPENVYSPDDNIADDTAPDNDNASVEENETPKSPFDRPQAATPLEAKGVVPLTVSIKPNIETAPLLPTISAIPSTVAPIKDISADKPQTEPQPSKAISSKDNINFYGMTISVPKIDFQIMQSMGRVADFARNWKLLDKQEIAEDLLDALKPEIKKLGLNDYLTYEFLCAYTDSKFSEASSAPKLSVVHYILSHLGYDVRVALATKTGDPLLLIPTKQALYGKTYLTINKENYYVFSAPDVNLTGSPIATCDLPQIASSGKKFDMRITGLNLPVKEYNFNISHGDLCLSGTLNANMMPVVYRYPQMDIAGFAESVLDENLRESLVAQVKEQIGYLDKQEAIDKLLQFVQSGFAYATDNAFHGFEKPYFLEENLFYPKNDCEDRAILYTYLLWNALGVENHLLFFPGHESASVALPNPIKGTSYEHNGKRFYISDPTYVGSHTGQCMPQYESVVPKIDLKLPE